MQVGIRRFKMGQSGATRPHVRLEQRFLEIERGPRQPLRERPAPLAVAHEELERARGVAYFFGSLGRLCHLF
ncbi:MAG: hypothetical protein ACRDIB_08825 [Ardenticatenaceae bacterium]